MKQVVFNGIRFTTKEELWNSYINSFEDNSHLVTLTTDCYMWINADGSYTVDTMPF